MYSHVHVVIERETAGPYQRPLKFRDNKKEGKEMEKERRIARPGDRREKDRRERTGERRDRRRDMNRYER